MNKKIDFNDVPKNYLYCTYNKCPRRNECLRHQATLRIPQNVPDFRTVNPNHIIGNENNCSFFQAIPYFTLCLRNRPHIGQHSIFYGCHHPQRIIFFDGAQHVLPHPQQRTDAASWRTKADYRCLSKTWYRKQTWIRPIYWFIRLVRPLSETL